MSSVPVNERHLRWQIQLDRTQIAGELVDFPLLVEVQDAALGSQPAADQATQSRADRIRFLDQQGTRQLDHEIEAYDPASGRLRAWVRLPFLSAAEGTTLTLELGAPAADRRPDATAVWRAGYRLVLHNRGTAGDSSAGAASVRTHPVPDGYSWLQVTPTGSLQLTNALTVEAWAETAEPRAEALQALVSQWTPRSQLDAFAAYDAGETGGLETVGFFGAVFDGRYVYFSPQHDRQSRHGRVLRYDSHAPFQDPASWEAYDAGHTMGLNTKGYYGAVFDGRYVVFPPRRDPNGFHSRALRYDTQGGFTDPVSWEAYDVGIANSCQSAAFDGRYIYFCPGQQAETQQGAAAQAALGSPAVTGMSADQLLVSSGNMLRYDTQGGFRQPASWTTCDVESFFGSQATDYDGAVYDGRYVYYAPLSYGMALRYDTQGEFTAVASWARYDAAPLGLERCVGAVFDGRFVYYVPYGKTPVAVRCDTRGEFAADRSWQTYTLLETPGLPQIGFDGAFFDGRYVYYIPYLDERTPVHHGVVLRYDTGGPFADPGSWQWTDAGMTDGLATVGFNGGAADGRYLYFAGWRDDTGFPQRIVGHGRVLRYDSVGEQGAFSLRWCDLGHNGGLCAALPGPRFLVNTVHGPVSVAANRPPLAGRHHLAGVYDGRSVRLYIDGELVNEQPTPGGAVVACSEEIAVGRILQGRGHFPGQIDEVRISAAARSGAWLRTQVRNQQDPGHFCQITAVG